VNAEQRRLWTIFAVNNGVNPENITARSKLCSRHFVPGQDFAGAGFRRRRLVRGAVPSVVSNQIVLNDHPKLITGLK